MQSRGSFANQQPDTDVGSSGLTDQLVRESRPALPTTQTLASASPPVGPARAAKQFDPESRRFADELANVVHSRLLAGNTIGAVAFTVMILVAVSSAHGRAETLSLVSVREPVAGVRGFGNTLDAPP